MSTIKVNFCIPLKKLDGTPILKNNEPLMANIFLANELVNQRASRLSMQVYELASRIYSSTEAIQITPSEKDIIVSFLESNDTLVSVLAAAQILMLVK